MKYSLVFLLLGLLITPVFTQDFEVAVTTVNVWIRATDASGKTVTGLNQADFEVYEDGKKMNPSCFEALNFSIPEAKDDAASDDASPQTAEAKAIQPKRFIVYLDLFDTSQAEM